MAERVLVAYGDAASYEAAWSGIAFPAATLEALRRVIDAI
jgi:hypothetical protein